ncbi:MAG: hypothetical protein CBB97_22475 [Candidatus Endolissoclinum sp. TMED37]|nr:MAG: hypothetical protein CBB97_22475 [Candidatus Endolissoclinum sp. TMED37]
MNYRELEINIEQTSPVMSEAVMDVLKKDLIVVIKKQNTDSLNFARLIHNMSNIANWQQLSWKQDGSKFEATEYLDPWECTFYPVQRVTAEKRDGQYTGIFPKGKLDWHANLNGPTRADGVALQGIRGVEGTVTSWLNTATALAEMPDFLKNKLENAWCIYTYNMENWADIPKEQLEFMKKNPSSYYMKILQENIAGTQGMYFFNNNDVKIVDKEPEIIDELTEYLFQEKFMYHHHWEVGDIVLSDQLLTLHRRPIRDDETFENRLLHRYTFPISNAKSNWIAEQNDRA